MNDRVGPIGNSLEPRFGWRPDLDPVPDLSPSTTRPPESPHEVVPGIQEANPAPAGEVLVSQPEAGDEPILEPDSDDEPISAPVPADESGPKPDVVPEPSFNGADRWEPSRNGPEQSALDVPDSRHRQLESPVRWFGIPPVMVYGLLMVLVFAGILGFGLWMRDQRASPAPTVANAPANTAGGSQTAVGGGVGVPDATSKNVTVKVGETVYLGLPVEEGQELWKVSSPDPAVLTPVKSPIESTAETTMVAFKAIGAGQTVITATRPEDCPAGQQCPDTARRFEETVVVVPG